jgi:hypothetical protein
VSTTTTEVYDASQKYNSDFDVVGNRRIGRRNPNIMESVSNGKTLENTMGINSKRVYVPQYAGQKDRYDVAMLQNDPEVLVSKARHDSRVIEIEQKQVTAAAETGSVEVSSYIEDSQGNISNSQDCREDNGVYVCKAFGG